MIYNTVPKISNEHVREADFLLNNIPESVKKEREAQNIVDKVKGQDPLEPVGPLGDLYSLVQQQNNQIMYLQSEIHDLKNMLTVLTTYTLKPLDSTTIGQMQNLKSRLGIYY